MLIMMPVLTSMAIISGGVDDYDDGGRCSGHCGVDGDPDDDGVGRRHDSFDEDADDSDDNHGDYNTNNTNNKDNNDNTNDNSGTND